MPDRRTTEKLLEARPRPRFCLAAGTGGAAGRVRIDRPARPGLPGRSRASPSGRMAACSTPVRRRSCRTSTSGSRRIGTRSEPIARRGGRADRRRRHGAARRRQHDLRSGAAAGRPAAADRDQLAAGGELVRLERERRTWCLSAATSTRGPACRSGRMPTRCWRGLNVRRAVLSVAGINERGFYNSNLLLVETERAMMQRGRRSDRRRRQHEVRPPSLAQLCALERDRHAGRRRRDQRRLAKQKIDAAGVRLTGRRRTCQRRATANADLRTIDTHEHRHDARSRSRSNGSSAQIVLQADRPASPQPRPHEPKLVVSISARHCI